jgi:hypothetical protein
MKTEKLKNEEEEDEQEHLKVLKWWNKPSNPRD